LIVIHAAFIRANVADTCPKEKHILSMTGINYFDLVLAGSTLIEFSSVNPEAGTLSGLGGANTGLLRKTNTAQKSIKARV
jgi:hypothetical protein